MVGSLFDTRGEANNHQTSINFTMGDAMKEKKNAMAEMKNWEQR